MTVRIDMPQLSSEGESATLASWLYKAGDRVEAGDVLAELETDKATVELESPTDGVLDEILVAAGSEDVAPGTLLATIRSDASPSDADDRESDEGSDSASSRSERAESARVHSESAASERAESQTVDFPPPVPVAATATNGDAGQSPASTPLARRAAAQRGLDLTDVQGSGARGKIVEADVLRRAGAAPSGRVDAPDRLEVGTPDREGTQLERSGASDSGQVIRMSIRCPMDGLIEVCEGLNRELGEAATDTPISVEDFIVKAVALSLREAQALWGEDRVDLGVVISTDRGVITPVLRDADRKSLRVLAEEGAALTERAHADTLQPAELEGALATITNFARFGIDAVQPICVSGQALALGVGTAEERPVLRDGSLGVARSASLTLVADPLRIDPGDAARWMASLRERLEDPLAMML